MCLLIRWGCIWILRRLNILGTWVRGTLPPPFFEKVWFNGNRKFALLNLPRMKFYNPRLDIKVFRRPWMGKAVQKTYPCAATILKGWTLPARGISY